MLPHFSPAPRFDIAGREDVSRAMVRSVPVLSLKRAAVPLVVGVAPALVRSEPENTTWPALFMSAALPVLRVLYATASVEAADPVQDVEPVASGKTSPRRATISS